MAYIFSFRYPLTVLMFLITLTANAGEDQERAVLSRLLGELNAVSTLIDEAQRSSDSDSRRYFNYPVLQRDLQSVRNGIQDYLNYTRREPRELPTIEGNYQQWR